AGPSSKRLRGPSKYSRWRTAVRLARLRSRTVRPLRPVIRSPPTARRLRGPPGPAPVGPATYLHGVTERDVLRHLSHAVNRPAGRSGGAPPARRKTVR